MVLICRTFNIEDLNRLRHQTAQVLIPGQCVHYSQFVVQILYAASICCCLLNKAERNLAEENNKAQLQNIVFIQNGGTGSDCLNPSLFKVVCPSHNPGFVEPHHHHTHTHIQHMCDVELKVR